MATPVELEQEIGRHDLLSRTYLKGGLESVREYLDSPAPDVAALREELRLARIEIKALEKFCGLLSENYDRLLASTRRK
jgi:hypothetical protein